MRIIQLPAREISRFGSHGVAMDFLPQVLEAESTTVHAAPPGPARASSPQSSLESDGYHEQGDRNDSGDEAQAKQHAAENHCGC